MKRLAKLFVAGAMTLVLAACGGGGDAATTGGSGDAGGGEPAAAAANLTDFEWCSFEVPEGYEVESEDVFEIIVAATDSDAEIHVHYNTTTFETAQTEAETRAGYSDKYTLEDPFEAYGRTWYLVTFDWNDVPSAHVYADWNEDYYVDITGFEVSNEDPAFQTVMETLVLQPENTEG